MKSLKTHGMSHTGNYFIIRFLISKTLRNWDRFAKRQLSIMTSLSITRYFQYQICYKACLNKSFVSAKARLLCPQIFPLYFCKLPFQNSNADSCASSRVITPPTELGLTTAGDIYLEQKASQRVSIMHCSGPEKSR